MGSDAVTLPLLEVLRQRADELLIVSQPDRPHGRGQKLTPNPVSVWALEQGIALERPEKLDADFLARLESFAPNVTLVMAYGKILRQPYLDLAPKGIWNFHVSLLPELRGASPMETAIAAGFERTGVCLMRMRAGMDTGEIAAAQEIAVPSTMTSAQLRQASALAAANLAAEHFAALMAGTMPMVSQNDSKATYCRLFSKADSFLDFTAPAKANVDRIRAFGEWLGVGFEHGGQKIKVFEAAYRPEATPAAPGTVLDGGEALSVATTDGILELKSLQRPGGKRLAAKDFLAGYPIRPGEVLEGRPFRELVRSEPFPRGF